MIAVGHKHYGHTNDLNAPLAELAKIIEQSDGHVRCEALACSTLHKYGSYWMLIICRPAHASFNHIAHA